MAATDHRDPHWQRAERHLRMIAVMFLVLAGAAAVAMSSIEKSAEPLYHTVPNWSPLGYTYSLALFAFPLLALSGWFLSHRKYNPVNGRAFTLTLLVIGPLWCVVDVLLANFFFRFPNKAAHIGPMFWGLVPGEGLKRSIPYEEFAFYFGAVTVIVLLYVWTSEVWYARYSLPQSEYRRLARETPPLVSLHWRTVFWGVATLATGLAYKKFGVHPHQEGIPGYFILLWVLAVVPTALLTRRLSIFMNDRAVLFTIMAVLLVSLLWEVTLALPNGWWDYRHEQMMGLSIAPWNNLPIEQIILWPASGWGNAMLFELFRVRVSSGRPFAELLFGWGKKEGEPA